MIHKQLAQIQQELKAPKNQYNSFGKYNYRSCEDITEAVKPHLKNLTLIIDDEIVMVGDRYYIRATATISDGESSIKTTAYAREPEDKKGMDSAQVTGATSSYARKYALNGLFALDDTKDSDSDKYKKQTTKPATKKVKPKTATTPKKITRNQMKMIRAMIKDQNIDIEKIRKHYGVESSKDLTMAQATDLIESLKKKETKNITLEDMGWNE